MNTNEIKLIGIGNAGIQVLERIPNNTIKNADLIVCDIDETNLSNTSIAHKIQIKAGNPRALSTKSQFEIEPNCIQNYKLDIALNATIDSFEHICSTFTENSKMAILIADLGDTTGTGVTPVIAQIAKKRGLFVAAVVFTPFSFMGEIAKNTSTSGVRKLRNDCDIVLVIDHIKLQEIYGNTSLKNYARKSDEIVIRLVQILQTSEVTKSHLSNLLLLFQDHESYLCLFIGIGEASGKWRVREAIEDALKNTLYYKDDIQGTTSIFVDIHSGNLEISIDDKDQIKKSIIQNAGKEITIEFSINQDSTLQDSISIMVIAH